MSETLDAELRVAQKFMVRTPFACDTLDPFVARPRRDSGVTVV